MANSRTAAYLWGFLFSTCLLVTVALLVVAALLIFLVPTLIPMAVNQKVTVLPGHATYKEFHSPTIPMWKSVYFFNLTNPEDFQAGAKPVLNEIGPYSYRENRTKTITVSDDNVKLDYTQSKVFHFDPNKSMTGAMETDVICTINIPLVTAVMQVTELTSELMKIVGLTVLDWIFLKSKAHLYICQEATPLVWNYSDSLVEHLHTNPLFKLVHMNYPKSYVSIQPNNSINDTMTSTIYTGVGDINKIGLFENWDGHHKKLDTWANGMGANDINGTEGFFFHPNQKEGETLEVFVDDVLRSFQMEYVGKVNHLGLEAYRYELPNSTFDSAFTNPDNARWGSWCPDGLFYIGPVQYPEVPVFGSKPHFLDGDPSLREKVIGLSPDPSKNRSLYDTVLDVQPTIGANIQFQRTLQINVQVNQSAYFSQLKNIDGTLYYPMMYINEHAEFTSDLKQYLESNGLSEINDVQLIRWIGTGVALAACIICFIISLLACLKFLYKRKSTDEDEPLLHNNDAVN